jgi:surface polysaccharide O-acyltransferase-like enzyme
MTSTERYHGLDALRAFAMFLGIFLHAAIAYAQAAPPFWPIREPASTPILDILLLAIHNFRLPLFFFLSGFFAALLQQRRGSRGLIVNRFQRIAIPLFLMMWILQPMLQAVWVIGQNRADPLGSVAEHFLTGRWVERWVPLHLWFLWYLLLLLLPGIGLVHALRQRISWGAYRWGVASGRCWLLLGLAVSLAQFAMPLPFGPDTPMGWLPKGAILAYYACFLAAGAILYTQPDQLATLAQRGTKYLLVANVGLLPFGLLASLIWFEAGQPNWKNYPAARLLVSMIFGMYASYSVAGWTGLALRYRHWTHPAIRWASDSAYWCYIASLLPILAGQFWLADFSMPPEIKALLLTVGSTILLLLSYAVMVRHTWIGRILNGRRPPA